MTCSNFPISNDTIFVADASVVINLNATGRAVDIIRAQPASVVVTENAFLELVAGERNGHRDSAKLQDLIESGDVGLVKLGDVGAEIYTSLVSGSAARTLDDGEAATIAYAQESCCSVLIDERKARKLCADEYPDLVVASSIDILTHNSVRDALGEKGYLEAIVKALQISRMRVPSNQVDMIIALIGEEVAATCNSLPGRRRSPAY